MRREIWRCSSLTFYIGLKDASTVLASFKRIDEVVHVHLHISRRIARGGIRCSKKVIQVDNSKKFFRFQYVKTLCTAPLTFNMAFLKICFESLQCSLYIYRYMCMYTYTYIMYYWYLCYLIVFLVFLDKLCIYGYPYIYLFIMHSISISSSRTLEHTHATVH